MAAARRKFLLYNGTILDVSVDPAPSTAGWQLPSVRYITDTAARLR
jgi:hypothetical protein